MFGKRKAQCYERCENGISRPQPTVRDAQIPAPTPTNLLLCLEIDHRTQAVERLSHRVAGAAGAAPGDALIALAPGRPGIGAAGVLRLAIEALDLSVGG